MGGIVALAVVVYLLVKDSSNRNLLAIAFALTLSFLAAGVVAFGIVVSIWHYPASPPQWLALGSYFSFMWPFVLLMKLLPRPECNGNYDYDSCGANGWAYILFIPILFISHTAFFYGLLSYIKNRRRP
jgi:hypothetical protein